MKNPPCAFVFDLDGTLLDSMSLVLRAYQQALAPYMKPISDAELLSRMGGPPQRIFEQLLQDSTHVTGALQRLDSLAAEAWRLVEPFPGMIEMLDALRAAGCPIAIWTGRERESTEWLLQKHGLASRIQAVVCGDDLPTHKPDPAGLAEALRRLGTSPAQAIFTGDAEVDLRAGIRLGVRTLYISHGVPPAPELRPRAWAVANTPAEAYDLLRRQVGADTRSS